MPENRPFNSVPPRTHPVMWLARVALLAWAGFWLWFTLAHAFAQPDGTSTGDTDPNDIASGLLIAIPVLSVGVIAWLYPRVGGVALIFAAGFAAWFFDDSFARLTLALPPALIGILLLAMSGRPSVPRV